MKYTAIISLLAAIVAADTVNQLVDQIPTCAVTCISDQSTAVGCDITNFACSCGKISELTPKVVSCLATSGCSTADQATVFRITPQICAQIGQTTVAAAADASSPTAAGATSATPPAAADKVQAAGWVGAMAAAAAAIVAAL
ncbi:hypothetical protein CGRA01v4_11053 [Colletotrichum graminicola]|uniref:CFEM domain-containing protein n=1 Tax=Colletotrichum graminicola (strain M1.001 / M2 / FGSC 10212) TaxID=645133 RepID=E3QKS3_COLGM|nr:uncharacterized protein GLRG_06605 [Colletotrichum graminicola M1.001]EFQ31461.1 hypothetical protein GLRG_06605 [Colletotrichum graminicola M1.001]WDK19766.1 hypothetical protein CGRA01v4_11053 [Colletotrichum graminicola]